MNGNTKEEDNEVSLFYRFGNLSGSYEGSLVAFSASDYSPLIQFSNYSPVIIVYSKCYKAQRGT